MYVDSNNILIDLNEQWGHEVQLSFKRKDVFSTSKFKLIFDEI